MTESDFISVARRVIRHEADALTNLAAEIGDGFEEAARLILSARGRVIVSGIGKSGHIARKIAATLASTGTPAQFVHPAEASHGDLGMVTSDDVALAISFSGEAPELSDLVAYTRRFNIPLIALSGQRNSTLVRQSDIAIILPELTEACQTGVVPTTSTTMTLAIGDALAVSLMEHRKFTAEHFREFHPGGKLGARLARVADLMHDDPPLLDENTPMPDALIAMTQSGYGMVGAVDADGCLVGIVTDGDLRRHMQGLMNQRVCDVMTRAPRRIAENRLAQEAVSIMQDNAITCLLVVNDQDDGKTTGIIRIHDCMRAGVI